MGIKTKSGAVVTLLGVQLGHGISPEELIESAGRTCYKSQDSITSGSAKKFVKSVIQRGHHSVIEHSQATFRIERISRACSHQLVRHRLMAVSQESQRYCDEAGMYKRDYFVVPKAVQDLADLPLKEMFEAHDLEALGRSEDTKFTVGEWYRLQIAGIEQAYRGLQKIIAQGKLAGLTKAKKNEDARYLLPNACCTEIVISANFREFRHLFEVRCDRHAQWEIREVACTMLRVLDQKAESVFGDLRDRLTKLSDGTEGLRNKEDD